MRVLKRVPTEGITLVLHVYTLYYGKETMFMFTISNLCKDTEGEFAMADQKAYQPHLE